MHQALRCSVFMKPRAASYKLFRPFDGFSHAPVPLVEIIANTRGNRSIRQFTLAATAVQRLIQKSRLPRARSSLLAFEARESIPVSVW